MFGLDNLIDAIFASATERLTRNERVIKLLKQFKLDPDHPPADFTGVYQYALVEYGVEKPRYVLAIFRQSEIQQLFREALEQNNPSALLRQGEAFLAQNLLGKEIQNHAVDVRREFYEFAAVFIEVAKRTRTPAEILTNQKLESLHRQIGGLQERLNRLPTIEGMRTEMARLAAQEYPALPGTEIAPETFSAEQCKAFALAQQMRGWFETLGFRFESHEVWQDDYFEWIINIPVRRGRYDRILVRGIDGEAGLPDVQNLQEAVETHRTDEGWLVTARRISRAARDEVEKTENDALGCFTFDELLDQDADFSGYLTWLESEIEQRGIDQKYVPLACLKEEIDPDTRQRIGVSRYDDRDGWIDGYIDLWLDDPAKEHISVLGEFGTGKTWFAFHYAWKALQRYREAQRRGLERPRLPLVVPLRDYAKAVSVESLFSEFFFRKHEIPIPGYSAFEQLNRMGKLLLIFDGFDEMAARVDRQQMINNFWELAKVVVPGAKVILTCRTEHFPEAKEGRALLNAELQASTKDLTGETPQFEVLELEKFNDEQIRQVLSHQVQPATVEQIMGNPELLDLARRPVLTELILEALPDIEAGKPVDMSRVYLYAVRHKMERDIKAERTFTSMADKLYFMCELSWEMLSTDRMSINYREFPDRIRKLFGPAVEEEKDLDHWHYDMMGQTMLIRNAEGDYTPAHRSLLEFFAAFKFAKELDLLASDFNEIEVPESFFKRSNLVETFGSLPLSKAIFDLLLPMLDKSKCSREKLLSVANYTKHKTIDEARYLGGNSINVLLGISNGVITDCDLSNTVILAADFSRARLYNVDMTNATLEQSNFAQVFSSISSMALSPDDDFLAVGDSAGEVSLWEISSSQKILSLQEHVDLVSSVAFSPCGQTIASGSLDSTIKVWKINESSFCTLRGHTGKVRAVSFSKDGKFLLSGSEDENIKIWDLQTSSCLKTLRGHVDGVLSVTYSPDNQIIASGSSDKTIRLWDANTGECISVLHGHEDIIWSVIFSPDGKMLANGGADQAIRLWSVPDGQCLKVLEAHRHRGIFGLDFNHDGNVLASAGADKTIRLWSIPSGKCINELNGHTDYIWSLIFSSNGRTLISGGIDQTIRFWDSEKGYCLKTLQGFTNKIWALAFSPDNNIIASGGEDKIIRIWDVKTRHCVESFDGHENWIKSIAFSANGKVLASGSSDKTIRIWDLKSGVCLRVLKGHMNWVRSVAFSPDSKLLASSSSDETIKLWSIQSGQCLNTLKSYGWIESVAFSPDGKKIVSSSSDKTIRIWEVQSGACVKVLQGHEGEINSSIFSRDGKTIISGSSDKTLRVWDVDTGNCLEILRGHEMGVRMIVSLAEGRRVASGSSDGTIRVWELKTGQCIKILNSDENEVRAVGLSPNEEFLGASAGEKIRLWKVGEEESYMDFKNLGPYEGLNITGVKGLTDIDRLNLRALGAVER